MGLCSWSDVSRPSSPNARATAAFRFDHRRPEAEHACEGRVLFEAGAPFMDRNQEFRETEITRDAGGNAVKTTERQVEPVRRRSNFGGGLVFGIVAVVVVIGAFAYSQGSFRNAGADADRAAVRAQESAGVAAQTTGDALETAGNNAKVAGDNARNATDTATPSPRK
jgi:hypothetical protein